MVLGTAAVVEAGRIAELGEAGRAVAQPAFGMQRCFGGQMTAVQPRSRPGQVLRKVVGQSVEPQPFAGRGVVSDPGRGRKAPVVEQP